MPKVSVYVPDAMYDELRRRDLPISQLAQEAFAAALQTDATSAWIDRMQRRPTRASALTTEELMDAVDAEFGA